MELGVKRYKGFYPRDPSIRKIFTNLALTYKQKAYFKEYAFALGKMHSLLKQTQNTLSDKASVLWLKEKEKTLSKSENALTGLRLHLIQSAGAGPRLEPLPGGTVGSIG